MHQQRSRIGILVAVFALVGVAPALGQEKQLRVRWDAETGSPAYLGGRLGRPFAGSSGEAALRFLSDRADLIFPTPPAPGVIGDPRISPLRVDRVIRRGTTEHVQVLQYHRGIPVHRGGYTVSFRLREGMGGRTVREPVAALGRVFPDIPAGLGVVPAIQRDQAIEEVLAGEAPAEPPLAWLRIYPREGAYHLAWEVVYRTEEPRGRWRVFLDARTGEVLERQDWLQHGTVEGRAYRHNPVQGPSLPEVLPLRDAYVDVGAGTVVTRPDGSYDDGGASSVSTAFVGPYADVWNEDVPEAIYTGGPDVLWDFGTTDTHFDEVNVFYHMNAFHGWVEDFLGFHGANVQLPAMVHYGDFYNNAFYDGFMIAFGDGDGIDWGSFAHDDIIYHEYGHFLFDRAIQMGYGYNEVGGMNEGYADYFAGAFSEDSMMGNATDLSGFLGRDLDNKNANPPRIYPDYLIDWGFEPHAGGEVWGGAVWDIRMALGGDVVDPVAFDALFYLPPGEPLFIDGREALLEADIEHHYGIHKYTIELLMWERGIGPPPDTDPFVYLRASPSAGVAPLPVFFDGIAVDNGSITNYHWDFGDGTIDPDGGPDAAYLYPSPGTYTVTLTVTDDTSVTASHSVQVDVTPPGTVTVTPEEMDIGFVRSDQPRDNFFGDDDVYAGYLAGLDYHGAALFRVPVIPGGTSDIVFHSATVELTGQDGSAKGPTGGLWSWKLLDGAIDEDWRGRGYDEIVSALPLYSLDPVLQNGDLVPGNPNTLSVTSAQLPSLHDRIATGSLAFRVDGPYGTNNLFSWDSGYDRFDEDPTAVRVKPVLRLDYTQTRQAGDLNADGVVDGTDARWAAEFAVGVRDLPAGDRAAGDADRNGVLDERDAAAILAKEAGLVDF